MQVLFHLEFSPGEPNQVFELICERFTAKKSVLPFARELVLGVCGKKEMLDDLIRRASRNWRLERMPRLDRCILRLAAFEILFLEDVPPKVSIDEALEMGKKFGSEDSARFINGVLDNIFTTLVKEGRLELEDVGTGEGRGSAPGKTDAVERPVKGGNTGTGE